ncbi:EAL domain-containing protein [Proteobacteria bacterium 005FR1]|nr:EAL domain-containing protein [Proteobacteria bacterium 005FR1]
MHWLSGMELLGENGPGAAALAASLVGVSVAWAGFRPVLDQRAALRKSNDDLRTRQEQLRMIFEHSPSGLMVTNCSGEIVMTNCALERLLGYGRGELIGSKIEVLLPERFRAAHVDFREDFHQDPVIRQMGQGRDLLARCKDGHEIEVEVGLSPMAGDDASLVLCSVVDISERKRLQNELARQARYDALTQLPNRRTVQAAIQSAIESAKANGKLCAVLFVDLDRFKDINDGWGHLIGDRVIQETAQRLARVIRREDVIGRLGGDEFVVVARDLSDRQEAGMLAQRLVEAMQSPTRVEKESFNVAVSIGIALYPSDPGSSGEDLLGNADAALYQAKEAGRGRWSFYSPELTVRAMERAWIRAQLREALNQQQLEVALQPVVSLDDHRPLSYEALVRWNHPERGPISPALFIAAAEHSEMIEALDNFVLRRSCHLAAELGLPIAVNISPRHLRSPHFMNEISSALASAKLSPRLLQLEITESAFVGDFDNTSKRLQALRGMGIEIAIDDFGTGYSSLQYLKRLPVDRLKIDQSFIRHLPDDEDSRDLVATIVSLAKRFGLRTTAEGVETAEQLACLRAMGCNTGQGYFFGRPEIQGSRRSELELV